MKRLFIFTLILVFSTLAYSQRTLNLSDFNEVSFGTSGTCYITQGNSFSVKVEASDDAFDDLEIKVKGDRLSISQEGSWFSWKDEKITVWVTMPEIEGLSVSGSGEMIGENRISSEDLDLSVSGSGDIELELDGNNLENRISGSGKIRLTGKANTLDVSISGSGKLYAEELMASSCRARISGSGSARVNVSQEIDASISGSGSVYYKGSPEKIRANSSGSGKVREL